MSKYELSLEVSERGELCQFLMSNRSNDLNIVELIDVVSYETNFLIVDEIEIA
jgi:hypothetical protein